MYSNMDSFERALSYFGNRVEMICAMEMSGKLTSEDAYKNIKDEIKDLKKVRKQWKKSDEYVERGEYTPVNENGDCILPERY